MVASDVLDRCSSMLNDVARVRWTAPMLLNYLTDAMRQTVLLRPESNALVMVAALNPGNTRQMIPSGAVRFLSLIRNMGADGQTAGYPITPTTREAMDSASMTWHMDAASDVIDHYLYNPDTPDFFFVTPPPGPSVYVEMECSMDVDDVQSMDSDLPLSGIWSEPLREYVMYRAYSVNGISQADRARADIHLRQFYLAVGEQAKAALIFNPYRPTFQTPQVAGGGQ